MNQIIGNKIITLINNLKSQVKITVKQEENNMKQVYDLSSPRYKTKIVIDPEKWLGMEFYLLDENQKTLLTYDLDTDLYDISNAKYSKFANSIEDEIIEFLEGLQKNKILVGEKNGKQAMIIPKGKEFMVISKGKILTSASNFKNIEDAKSNGEFSVL